MLGAREKLATWSALRASLALVLAGPAEK